MRISRIFIDQPLASATLASLPPAAAHYVAKVLRLGAGAPLTLFNGDGHEYAAVITEAGKKQVHVAVGERRTPATESPLQVHIGLGISRGERMDLAVQKSVELGIARLTPLFTEHCEVKLAGERAHKRQAHWQQIAVSACEQSGRVRVPPVDPPRPLGEWLREPGPGLRLVLDHRQESSLSALPRTREAVLLIGPEGGLSEEEVAGAHAAGFQGLRLGARVLRTETAPLAALAVLQFVWGDMGFLGE